MSRIDVDQVLSQMRAMAAQAQGNQPEVTKPGETGFADLLKNSIEAVNDRQQNASELARAFDTGQGNVDLGQVMVEVQKASVSFQAMVQVRNKLVEAYKDVMSMPI